MYERQIIERFDRIPSNSHLAFEQAVVEVITHNELYTDDFWPLVEGATCAFNEMRDRLDFGCSDRVRGVIADYYCGQIERRLKWYYDLRRIPLPTTRPVDSEPEQLPRSA